MKFQYVRLLFFIFLVMLTNLASANTRSSIPLDSIRTPSNDLLHPTLGLLQIEQAWRLQQDPSTQLDLSKLDPINSEVWSAEIGSNTQNDQDLSLPIKNGATLSFQGVLSSASGTLRFNTLDSEQERSFIVMLDKRLHTTLLRKNLLRRVGYIIPAMKYLKTVTISFEDSESKKLFLTRHIPEGTFGAASRWVVENSNPLQVELQDVVVMQPSSSDHYNTALGVPPRGLRSRTLRSLLIPYALLDLGESINQLSWKVGREDNGEITLPHFTPAQMNCTIDDARWMLRRLARLTRAEFEQIVQQSFFPSETTKLLVEKLINRRNSLITLFKFDANNIVTDRSIPPLPEKEWSGFASRFAHGLPDSPFQQMRYYAISEAQTTLINQMVDRLNQRIELFDLSEPRLDYYRDEFKQGLEHFIKTGEFLEQEVGTWFSPTLNGGLILSRSLVIGNYQGNDKLVQHADTIGYYVKVGGHLGIEGLPMGYSASAAANLNLVTTYTHLTPVTTLKSSLKTPLKNMIVPLTKKMLRDDLEKLARLGDQDQELSEDERNSRLKELADLINQHLGVGESMIISKKVTPAVQGSIGYSWMGTKTTLSASVKDIHIKRVHLMRQSADKLVIFIDRANATRQTISLTLKKFIPLIRFELARTKGEFLPTIYSVNVNSDPDRNPAIYSNANAVAALLRDGSVELLNELAPPYKLETQFTDFGRRFALLFWRSLTISKSGVIQVETPEGGEASLYKYTYQKRSGRNYHDFALDVASYFLMRDSEATTPLHTSPWKNPAQTTAGHSKTRSARFESRYNPDATGFARFARDAFLSLQYRQEGWSLANKKLSKVTNQLNQHYGFTLFSADDVIDATDLMLYNVTVSTNIYQKGVQRLANLSRNTLKPIERRYYQRSLSDSSCQEIRYEGKIATPDEQIKCGNLSSLAWKAKSCRKKFNKRFKKGRDLKAIKCLVKFTKRLEEVLDFSDLLQLIGEDNYFVYGKIEGFRSDSEILADPILSNTMGIISDRHWNGPVEALRTKIGATSAEFDGLWIREH
jgi:hypothetical protein